MLNRGAANVSKLLIGLSLAVLLALGVYLAVNTIVDSNKPQGAVVKSAAIPLEIVHPTTLFSAHNSSVETIDCFERLLLTGGIDGKVRLWKFDKKGRLELIAQGEHDGLVSGAKLLSETAFITSSVDGKVVAWRCRNRVLVSSVLIRNEDDGFASLCASTSGETLVSTDDSRNLTIWQRAIGGGLSPVASRVAPFGSSPGMGSFDRIVCAADSEASLLLSAGNDGTVTFWNIRSDGAKILSSWANSTARAVATMTNDGKFAATIDSIGFSVDIWDRTKERHFSKPRSVRWDKDRISCLSLASLSHCVAIGDDEGNVSLVNHQTGAVINKWTVDGQVTAMHFSDLENVLFVGTSQGTLYALPCRSTIFALPKSFLSMDQDPRGFQEFMRSPDSAPLPHRQ